MTAEADWGPDGWAVRPGEGDFIELGGPHRPEIVVRVGGAEFSGGPGTTVVVPRGAYHTFVTPTGGKLLFASVPAGNGELFEELGRLGPNPPADQVADIDRRFGTTRFPGQ
jgi:hypothetical protein